MPKYRVVLTNGIVMDVRDPREYSEIVQEWIDAVNYSNKLDKQMEKSDDIGLPDSDDDDNTSFDVAKTLVFFRGEPAEGNAHPIGASALHAMPIMAIGAPEEEVTKTRTLSDAVQEIVDAYKATEVTKTDKPEQVGENLYDESDDDDTE